ncbi:MAG TPA: Fe-Mn family superoxide dismutase [Planctomycetota bacterium]|nr:Fe-Mn family superoxide dismutase [Planctomycetota bacterium]
MAFELPALPYAMDALAPHLSKETLEYHYGKHHKTYVDKLNGFLPGTKYEKMSLEEIILSSGGEAKIFNNAAQIWNHTFYWNGLSPKGGGEPKGAMADAIKKAFGGFGDFQKKFTDTTVNLFGSAWGWLVKKSDGTLDIVGTKDAGNPMTDKHVPLLTCDVWEHAYYIDYRNARPKYLESFWKLVNWDFVEKNLKG